MNWLTAGALSDSATKRLSAILTIEGDWKA